MIKTIEKVGTPAEGIQLMGTHEYLIQKRQVLVAKGIVDTATGIPFNNKVANLSSSYKLFQLA